MVATSFYRPQIDKLNAYKFVQLAENSARRAPLNMSVRLGIVMDPIGSIQTYKDSSFAMLLAAQAHGWQLFYMEQSDLYLKDGRAFTSARKLTVKDSKTDWYQWLEPEDIDLSELDVILMRKDPPVDQEFFYTTYLLEIAKNAGVLVVNDPESIRNSNEKLFTSWFPQCCVPSVVSRKSDRIREFLREQGDIILKPLDAMGGASIFRLTENDPNTSVILETLTQYDTVTAMAQRYIPEISAGDKRILMIDGKPIPYALARIPADGETRGNLAAGGRAEGIELSERDHWICEQVGPELRRRGLLFVGIDVIGDYLTEINVTSPTCIRELDQLYSLDIAGQLMDCIAKKLA